MRAISRITGVSINSVSKLLVDAGLACAAYHDEHVRGLKSRKIQCDEIWAFYFAKDANVTEKMKGKAGSIWTWTSLDSDSKLICNWYVGTRDLASGNEFMKDLASRLQRRVQLTTDGHGAYVQAVSNAFGIEVDFAQLVKIYGASPDKGPERRYSGGVCLGAEKHPVTGNPEKKFISTSHVERANLSMRMGMRRFTRLTNAHSKKLENHCHAVALYFMFYNFVRIHQAVEMSPAMAAGIENHLWEMKDLVRMIDTYHLPKPSFKAMPLKDGSGYYVLMAPNAYAPTLHIEGFKSEREARAWIELKSDAWFAKLASSKESDKTTIMTQRGDVNG
jgi:IS1 family transposase